MTTTLNERIEALVWLGKMLNDWDNPEITAVIEQAYAENPWFTPENIKLALTGIQQEFLDEKKLKQWLSNYEIVERGKANVGLILAGNIPAVGFHDVLCCFVSGHKAKIKWAEKDKVLMPFLLKKMTTKFPKMESHFTDIERLTDFDAIIATGSNNSARYFESYFSKYPHIIRKNRNGIAILDGSETKEELYQLGTDVFNFFGLGCRNVAKLFVPENYQFDNLLEIFHEFNSLVYHNKYKNNFDYNIALFLLNKVKFVNNGCIILMEDKRYASRISALHYEYYTSSTSLINELNTNKDKIQCIVSRNKLEGIKTFNFGESQKPSLSDYADGVDTMTFFCSLKSS